MESARSNGKQTARHVPWDRAAVARFAWTLVSAFVVESLIFGLAVLPAALFWQWHFTWPIGSPWLRIVALAMSFLPAYLLFCLMLMALSALALRALGWRPPARAELRISDLGWPLANWARYGIASHIVRVLAGPVFRNTPVWVWYMRLNGACMGRRVWVNSLDVTDHCLLEFGDDVVIGAGVHLSGHTVERGIVRTAPVRLGAGTMVGVNTHVEIDVETGPGCQIGSLAMVPKGSRLEGDSLYVGCPVRKLERGLRPPTQADRSTPG
jgi:acetyltransferase-like isoleucine patch superfamily enzyme